MATMSTAQRDATALAFLVDETLLKFSVAHSKADIKQVIADVDVALDNRDMATDIAHGSGFTARQYCKCWWWGAKADWDQDPGWAGDSIQDIPALQAAAAQSLAQSECDLRFAVELVKGSFELCIGEAAVAARELVFIEITSSGGSLTSRQQHKTFWWTMKARFDFGIYS